MKKFIVQFKFIVFRGLGFHTYIENGAGRCQVCGRAENADIHVD